MILLGVAISLHCSLITIIKKDLTCHHHYHYLPEHDQSRGYLSNIDWDPAMAVKLPKHSQQLLTLFDLLDTLKADSTDHSVGGAQSKSVGRQGLGKAAFKGIIFVEQVALTYPLAHLINQHYMKVDDSDSSGSNQCATCLKPKRAGAGEPTALPVSGTGSMLDAIRWDVLSLVASPCHALQPVRHLTLPYLLFATSTHTSPYCLLFFVD
jgi:hypothetical protein